MITTPGVATRLGGRLRRISLGGVGGGPLRNPGGGPAGGKPFRGGNGGGGGGGTPDDRRFILTRVSSLSLPL